VDGVKKLFGRYLWEIFALIGLAALACTFFRWERGSVILAWDPSATGTVLADLLIATIIFVEVEQARISTFLNDALGQAYTARADLYDAFTSMPGASLGEKAKHFADHLWGHQELREIADQQLAYFSRAHFMGEGSFMYKNLVADWLPQGAVRMWAMVDVYVTGNDRLGPRAAQGLAIDAMTSVDRIHRMGIKYLVIPSKKGDKNITISVNEMDEIKNKARIYIRQSQVR
jgi:hypothetical protein